MSKVKEPTLLKKVGNIEIGYSSGLYFYINDTTTFNSVPLMWCCYLPSGTKFFKARSMMLKVFDTICQNF